MIIINKNIRLVAIIALFVLLIALPFMLSIYHLLFYYVFIALLFVYFLVLELMGFNDVETIKSRWQKTKKKGRTYVVLRQSIINFVQILIVVFFGQYVGNNLTPANLYKELSTEYIILMFVLVYLFSLLIGFIYYNEHNKKY